MRTKKSPPASPPGLGSARQSRGGQESIVQNRQNLADSYDVAVLGGGLAGFTCALQIKLARPETRVMLGERRGSPAPEAAWKVGESTQEIAPHYWGHVLGLQEHLDEHHIVKCGLRFWWPA